MERLTPLDPAKLNARQRENYHFQKLSAVLAERLLHNRNGLHPTMARH